MRRIRLLVVGPPSFLSPAVRQAWTNAGIDLQGPVAAADLAKASLGAQVDGAIIDVGYDAVSLLGAVEIFDSLAIPALFAGPVADSHGGFTFSAAPANINAIVHQLLGSHQTTLQ
ncbi:hypothetical protein ABID21_000169 [Pseudorhizobium tarimense]|uniref:Uncharacterized protein n=1 Tax=Pseudorhizobium tarimense TaxID=1079109 RepID=A0ABV2H184_9HYPH|nr:hypothetical protein [Pseudorhizobium tarimense]MCJ8517411.1 hypothetical protein [Pseudorhizobium tarimense]